MFIQPRDGRWYIVTTSEKCDSTIFLFPDLNNGAASLNASYFVTCPLCQHQGHYEGRHYQHSSTDSNVDG